MSRAFGPMPTEFPGSDDPTVAHAISLHDDWSREHGWWWNRGAFNLRLDERGGAPTVLIDDSACSVLWSTIGTYRVGVEGASASRSYRHHGHVPDTLMSAIVGRPLSLLFETPGFDSRIVLRVETDAAGTTIFELD